MKKLNLTSFIACSQMYDEAIKRWCMTEKIKQQMIFEAENLIEQIVGKDDDVEFEHNGGNYVANYDYDKESGEIRYLLLRKKGQVDMLDEPKYDFIYDIIREYEQDRKTF